MYFQVVGLDNSLATHEKLAIPLKNHNAGLWGNGDLTKRIPGAGVVIRKRKQESILFLIYF